MLCNPPPSSLPLGSVCACAGSEAVLERVLGKEAKTDLVHVDMGARLEAAGLDQFKDAPNLWPPTLAVCGMPTSCLVCTVIISTGTGAGHAGQDVGQGW